MTAGDLPRGHCVWGWIIEKLYNKYSIKNKLFMKLERLLKFFPMVQEFLI